MRDRPLIEIVSEALEAKGYVQVEPSSRASGGRWTHPDWDEAIEKILVAIGDCFDREAVDGHA